MLISTNVLSGTLRLLVPDAPIQGGVLPDPQGLAALNLRANLSDATSKDGRYA